MTTDGLDEQRQETRLIVEELLDDGSDPDALYTIEHHLSAETQQQLEQVKNAAFRLGYQITDIEQLSEEGNQGVFCCDVISEVPLRVELIDSQVEQLMVLAKQYAVSYDGWGTYFEDPDGEDDDDDEADEWDDTPQNYSQRH